MNSIKQEISPHTLFNQIKLERAAHERSFLLVEGDTDGRVFVRFINTMACSLIVCVNRDNVLRTIERLDADGFRGAVGLVDSDYCKLLGIRLPSPNICRTDTNDLESLIIDSEAFDKILLHYGSQSKVGQIEREHGRSLRAIIYAEAASVGALRLAAKRAGWAVKFSGMSYAFASNASFEIDNAEVCRHVLARSQLAAPTPERLTGAAQQERADAPNDLALCNGDDLLRVVARALKRRVGTYNGFERDPGELAKALYLAFELGHLSKTALYQCLRHWEKNNAPLTVLLPPPVVNAVA
jgi:Protein of unknown function (DUF4435)